MSNQTAYIEDPEELNILRAINRGETRLETVDWKPYLSNLVKKIGLMENPYTGPATEAQNTMRSTFGMAVKQASAILKDPEQKAD